MSKAADRIMQGLNEALAFAQRESGGDMGGTVTLHHIRVPAVNVREIRAKTGLSQQEFSQTIGVAKGTLLNWEQGRRAPTGPAMVLLAMLDKDPSLVTKMLGSGG